MSLIRSLRWLCCVFALVSVVGLRAQDGPRYLIPEKIERATKTDEKGFVQWADYDKPKCATCSGTGKTKCVTCARFADDVTTCPECKRTKEREAVCRVCAGAGSYPDPLEKVVCPGCMGASFHLCLVCGGGGRIKIGDDKRFGDCVACRGTGGWKCGVCNGTRTCEVAGLKPSLKDAGVANLDKAIATTDQALAGLATFTPAAKNTRKEVKELAKQLAVGQQVYAPLKRAPKALDDYMGKLAPGEQFKGHEENEAQAMGSFKSGAEYYLKHQKRMLELAKKRAEANEKLQAENKAK